MDTIRKERKKRICLTLQDKSKIITELQQGAQMSGLAEKYGVSLMTIYSIRKHAAEIISAVGSSYVGPTDQKKVMRAGEFAQMEERLYQWFCEQRQRDAPISGELLKAQALLYFGQCRSTDSSVFYASEGWLQNFKNRFGIRLACGEPANGLGVNGGGGGGGGNGMIKMSASPDSVSMGNATGDPLKVRMNEILRELNLSNLATGDDAANIEWSDEDGRNAQSHNGDHFINPAQFLDDTESEHDPNNESTQQNQTTSRQNATMPEVRSVTGGNNLLLRNINTLKRGYAGVDGPKMYGGKFKMPRHSNYGASASNMLHAQIGSNNASSNNFHHTTQQLQQQQQQQHQQLRTAPQPHQSSDKFNAFGLFLTSSLLDMPENKALGLVEKFTNEIVRALIDKTSTATSGDEIANTPASANSSTTVEENNV